MDRNNCFCTNAVGLRQRAPSHLDNETRRLSLCCFTIKLKQQHIFSQPTVRGVGFRRLGSLLCN